MHLVALWLVVGAVGMAQEAPPGEVPSEPTTEPAPEPTTEPATEPTPGPDCPECDCACEEVVRAPSVVAADGDEPKKNFRFSPYAAPGYSPEVGGLLSAGALFSFSLEPSNDLLPRSTVPVSLGISTTGAVLFSALPQLFLARDRFRISANLYTKYMVDNYWGVGFDEGLDTPQGPDTTAYQRLWWQVNPRFVWQFHKHLFLGAELDFNQTVATDLNPKMAADPHVTADGTNNYNGGIGAVFQYDSRDMPQNAFKGMFLELRFVGYGPYFASNNTYAVVHVDYRHYVTLSKKRWGSTISWWFRTRNIIGAAPWSELSLVGSPFDLRGYYWGRFRDAQGTTAVLEYRYMFGAMKNPDRPGFSRHGLVFWAGLGFLTENFIDADLLPNVGVGYRFEVQPRMNLRVDIGYGLDNSTGFYVNFLESF